ncbi:hypothetical protein B5S31_g4649 [[Candida] boidinii]|nr:hypothetical protein B5S29_g2446 [[Candida] boidinii]OWB74823.1 hypothetical protein B5S31_g4649 [[Candida] boidinii]OWB79473.1 hypothetical protein B5S32_g3695 [[Candida] boidinii]GMF07026.1 unnamed protein product [[Candida] boidinii]
MSGGKSSSYISISSPSSSFNSNNSRFKRYTIIVGIIIALILFKLSSNYSISAEDQIINDALNNFYRLNPKSRGANPYDASVTADRLAKMFPYDETPRRIDKNIWQMWRVKASDPDFPHKNLVKKWKNENPTYKYNLLTDAEILDHLRLHFKETVPEVLEAFEMLPEKIIRSDFSRYLMIFLNGGVYADVDTDLEKPVDTWFDADRNVGFVVSVEEDINVENWQHYMTRRIQFEQWIFKAKPRHPILRKLIAKIVETTFAAKKNDKLQAYYKDFKGVDRCQSIDIMEWTGPVVWTDTIYSHLNSLKNPTIVDIDYQRDITGELYGPEVDEENEKISWKFFAGLKAPVMVDDVVIYPRASFREDKENNCGKYCYVHHQFGGSWKNNGKGEIKPGMEGYDGPDPDEVDAIRQKEMGNAKRKRDFEDGDDINSNEVHELFTNNNDQIEFINPDDINSNNDKIGKLNKRSGCAYPYKPYL